jgi:hypothetical protein
MREGEQVDENRKKYGSANNIGGVAIMWKKKEGRSASGGVYQIL